MRAKPTIDRYGTMDPDLLACLEECQEQMEYDLFRTVRCPRCGFSLLTVQGRDHYIVQLKCRKCKFNEPIDTALFRTVKVRGALLKHRREQGLLR